MSTPDRSRARALAADAVAAGDAVGWFETLYAEAEAGAAVVPWADLEPNPFVVRVIDALPVDDRAIVVGCGYGDDAAYLAQLGWDVTAFDVSPTSVAAAAARWGGLPIVWETCDVLEPFRGWLGAFDLVVEVYTVQVLPPDSDARARAIDAIASLVAPGGRLVVVARARTDRADAEGVVAEAEIGRGREGDDDDAPASAFPWPLARAEVDAFAAPATGLVAESVVLDVDRSEDEPVGRWVARFVRAR